MVAHKLLLSTAVPLTDWGNINVHFFDDRVRTISIDTAAGVGVTLNLSLKQAHALARALVATPPTTTNPELPT